MNDNKKTTSNINLKNFYGDEKSSPGKFPFRSGIYTDMYRGKLWTMRQYSGFTSCEESNKRYQYLLSKGAKGLSIAFDFLILLKCGNAHPSPLFKTLSLIDSGFESSTFQQ